MKKNTAKINNFDDAPFIVISLGLWGKRYKGDLFALSKHRSTLAIYGTRSDKGNVRVYQKL